MKNTSIEDQAGQFCKEWQGLNMIYEDYARSVNVPYTTLFILNLITQIEKCTQKDICERAFLPKQTVNSVITGFYKQQLVELREMPEDRRVKTIHLTKKGQEYADSILPQIKEAEYNAMAELSDEQRRELLNSMKLYGEVFRRMMFKK